ncbi:hypothetical protein BX666DRAFT_1878576 [Dichotomocladium elegans]|nr:hypothetical protein BX666DRAFT_1878576 [Dichotomocladium elegans]
MGAASIIKKHYQQQQQQHMITDVTLAPPIQHATIIGEKQVDQQIWYVIQVVPLRINTRLAKGTKPAISRKYYTIVRRYDEFVQLSQKLIDEFSADASAYHPPTLTSRAGQRLPVTALPKLSNNGCRNNGGKRLHILQNKKHVQNQRRAELDAFIDMLFRLHPSIVQSPVMLEFFGQKKYDALSPSPSSSRLLRAQSSMTKDHVLPSSSSIRRSVSHPELVHDFPLLRAPGVDEDHLNSQSQQEQQPSPSPPPPLPPIAPLWRRFRTRGQASLVTTPATGAAARPVPQPSSSLTVLCNQAANMIMPWKQQQQQQQQQQQPPPPLTPSRSTPTVGGIRQHRVRKQSSFQPPQSPPPPPLPAPTPSLSSLPRSGYYPAVISSSITSSTSTGSSCYSRDSQSTGVTSLSPSPTTSPTLRMIKFKVVYDVDNIIVVQIPRSASLADLRHRILQKFSDLAINPGFSLVFNDTRSSASSNTSAADAMPSDNAAVPSTTILIEKEEDFVAAMGSLWVRLDKVTLRCIVP